MRQILKSLGMLGVGLSTAILFASTAQAVPLDFSDPTPRRILVEVEGSSDMSIFGSDLGAIFAPLPDGNGDGFSGNLSFPFTIPTVTIQGADWEQALIATFGLAGSPDADNGIVAGSTSNFSMSFDQSGNLIAANWTATLLFSTIPLNLVGSLGSDPDGFYTVAIGPTVVDISCAAGNPTAAQQVQCDATNRPFVSYDPTTGAFTGPVTVNNGVLPPAYAPADFRLMEIPEPGTLLLLAGGLAVFAVRRRSA